MSFKWSIPSLMVARYLPAPTGILNDYPGATIAYSLRLLDTTYSGPAIRVRRSSDDAEQDIGFNGFLLDTADLFLFVGEGGDGYVTKWYDQSGNGRDLIQATAANQPMIMSLGEVIVSGTRPAIQSLANSSYMKTSATAFINLSTHSDFVVLEQVTPVPGGAGAATFAPAIGDDYGQDDALIIVATAIVGGLGIAYVIDDLVSEIYQLVSHIIVSGSGEGWQNGVSIGTDSYGGFTTMGGFFLLGARFLASAVNTSYSFQGYFQEIIIYQSDQSTNRAAIQSNINSFYSIF